MAKNDAIRTAPRSDARNALAKCHEFIGTAHDATASSKWNAAALSAVHAGIAAADAALIASAGMRSASQDHGAVITLLEHQVPEFTATQRRQLIGLLKMKNQVSYEQRLLAEVEARQLVDQATRLSKWAAEVVGSHM